MIVKTLAHYPEVVEKYYSMGFYPLLSKTFRFLFGSLSFSIGDVMYGFMLVLVVKWFLKNKKTFLKIGKKIA